MRSTCLIDWGGALTLAKTGWPRSGRVPSHLSEDNRTRIDGLVRLHGVILDLSAPILPTKGLGDWLPAPPA